MSCSDVVKEIYLMHMQIKIEKNMADLVNEASTGVKSSVVSAQPVLLHQSDDNTTSRRHLQVKLVVMP